MNSWAGGSSPPHSSHVAVGARGTTTPGLCWLADELALGAGACCGDQGSLDASLLFVSSWAAGPPSPGVDLSLVIPPGSSLPLCSPSGTSISGGGGNKLGWHDNRYRTKFSGTRPAWVAVGFDFPGSGVAPILDLCTHLAPLAVVCHSMLPHFCSHTLASNFLGLACHQTRVGFL